MRIGASLLLIAVGAILKFAVTKQVKGFPRVRNRYLRLGLAAHAGIAAFPALATRKRTLRADHMSAATFAGSSVASISTQRSGSLAAICR